MDVKYQRTRHYEVFEEDERCNECRELSVQDACNKCGEGVCLSNSCCEVFPHYNNSNYTICRKCTSSIENKLRLIINYGELKLLKQKITKRLEKKIKQLEGETRV